MSGVCGYWHLSGAPAAIGEVERQIAVLGHRGPDRRRAWAEGPVAFGHLLMRITPEDLTERQPLHDLASGLALTADLRLDNRAELIGAMGLSKAAADWPDSRLLLTAWQRWGERCIERLIGDFALAVWDGRERTLTLARDGMGQRSLYYHQGPRLVAFASEVKGLWALPDVPRGLDRDYLAERLSDVYVGYRGRTHFQGIHAVPAGRVLVFGADGGRRERTYWEPHPDPAMIGRPKADYVEAYRAILGEAVACRLRGTRPAALMFSGGIDSGAIAALAGPVLRRQGRKLLALSSVLPDALRSEGARDTRYWADSCASVMPHLDLRHLTAEGRTALDGLDQALPVDEGTLLYIDYAKREMLEVAAASGVRTLLDGQGGDLTLNPRNVAYLPLLLRRGHWRRFANELAAHRRATGHGLGRILISDILRPQAPWAVREAWDRLRDRQWYRFGERLLRGDFAASTRTRTGRDPRRFVFRPPPEYRPRDESVALLDFIRDRAWLPEINSAAAFGLETAQPFYDRRVVELALAVPELLYVEEGRERPLAHAALHGLLPPELAERDRTNHWFAPDFLQRHRPLAPLIKAELDRLQRAGIADDMLDYAAVKTMLSTSLSTDGYGGAVRMVAVFNALYMGRMIEWFDRPNR